MVLGGPLGISQFVMAVCFARVYFHCHYLFDVLGGMFFGILVASILVRLGSKEILKNIFFKYLQFVITGGDNSDDGFGGDDDMYNDM